MGFYKNEETLKERIVGYVHTFIYGYNGDSRTQFLKGIEEEYPVRTNNNQPVVLYLDQLGFQDEDVELRGKSIQNIYRLSEQYINFCVIARILERTLESGNHDLSKLIENIKPVVKSGTKIETIEDLLREINISKEFLSENYYKYIRGTISGVFFSGLAISEIILNEFIKKYKESMGMHSHFSLIYDKKGPISIYSEEKINDLIGSQIASLLSINVATDPNEWTIYEKSDGTPLKIPRNYSIVELDDSYQKSIGGI